MNIITHLVSDVLTVQAGTLVTLIAFTGIRSGGVAVGDDLLLLEAGVILTVTEVDLVGTEVSELVGDGTTGVGMAVDMAGEHLVGTTLEALAEAGVMVTADLTPDGAMDSMAAVGITGAGEAEASTAVVGTEVDSIMDLTKDTGLVEDQITLATDQEILGTQDQIIHVV